jgi:hypothetical protein
MKTGKAPAIYNKTMTLANTEYSQALGNGVVKLLVQCRGGYDTKIAFYTGTSGTNYMTLKAGAVYYEDMVDKMPSTIYFQCATAGQVLEIVAWEA